MNKIKQRPCSPLEWKDFKFLLSQLFTDSRIEKRKTLAKYHTIIACGGYMGLRPKALLSLSWLDILNKKSDFFRESKIKKNRKIKIHEDLQTIIQNNFAWLDPQDLSIPIVHNRSGERIATQSFNEKFRKLLSKYEITTDNPSAVTLRKTYAYRLWIVGNKSEEALLTVQKALGHETREYTMDYIGINNRKIEDLIDKM